jgi:hypothetical protein
MKCRFLFFLLFAVSLLGCSPEVEEVSYAIYYRDNLYNDSTVYLDVRINTRRGLFKGRESLLNFKRETYSIALQRIDDSYMEKDMSITFGRPADTTVTPRYGRIFLKELDSKSVTVTIEIIDNLIPRLVNGVYELKVRDKTNDYIWYQGN